MSTAAASDLRIALYRAAVAAVDGHSSAPLRALLADEAHRLAILKAMGLNVKVESRQRRFTDHCGHWDYTENSCIEGDHCTCDTEQVFVLTPKPTTGEETP